MLCSIKSRETWAKNERRGKKFGKVPKLTNSRECSIGYKGGFRMKPFKKPSSHSNMFQNSVLLFSTWIPSYFRPFSLSTFLCIRWVTNDHPSPALLSLEDSFFSLSPDHFETKLSVFGGTTFYCCWQMESTSKKLLSWNGGLLGTWGIARSLAKRPFDADCVFSYFYTQCPPTPFPLGGLEVCQTPREPFLGGEVRFLVLESLSEPT